MDRDRTNRTPVLLVADWNVDPHAVIAAAARREQHGAATFGLLVPAWLHGLDWAGDPGASVPCARRQLEELQRLSAAAGLAIGSACVGDPDPITAILDALDGWRAGELLVCMRPRRVGRGPLDVARRARRLTGLPVERVAVSAASPRCEVRPRRRAAPIVAMTTYGRSTT